MIDGPEPRPPVEEPVEQPIEVPGDEGDVDYPGTSPEMPEGDPQ